MSVNYTYMLRCSDNSLYTGWTNNLEGRVAVHNAKKGGKYTRVRTPVELVYFEVFETKEEAMRREFAIKQLTRRQKEQLIGNCPANGRAVSIQNGKEPEIK